MEIKISSKHMDLTPAIQEYASTKAEKFTRYFARVQQVTIVLDKANNGYTVEIFTDVGKHDAVIY